jgi:hypothetical protein
MSVLLLRFVATTAFESRIEFFISGIWESFLTIQEEQLKEAELSQLDDDAELLLPPQPSIRQSTISQTKHSVIANLSRQSSVSGRTHTAEPQ